MYGETVWRKFVEKMRGENAWRKCMEKMHGKYAWENAGVVGSKYIDKIYPNWRTRIEMYGRNVILMEGDSLNQWSELPQPTLPQNGNQVPSCYPRLY